MNEAKVRAAKAEALRFIERCDALIDACAKDNARDPRWATWGHPKEQGAVRRASMDLTRSLAEMRRPG